MTESATNAPINGSGKAEANNIMERLQEYQEANPDKLEYWIEDEGEAAELLLAMAASLKLLMADINDDESLATMRNYANTYRAAVQQGKALNYLRNLTDSDAIAVWGMRIRARTIIH